jgi:hypothetical protein
VTRPFGRPLHRPTALAATLATLAGAVLALAQPSEAGARDSLAPDRGAYFGAFVQKRTEATHYAAVRAFEKMIGRKLAIDHEYQPWVTKWWTDQRSDIAAGRIPMVSWPSESWPAGVTAASISAGKRDANIRATADQLKALHGPVLLRFAFEMDQPSGSGRYIGQPRAFRQAWRHVHRIFTRRGATNVRWVFCGVASNYKKGWTQKYYPGGRYVDWIAADGFSFYPVKLSDISEWRTIREIFGGFYTWAAKKGKPLMIAATGVQDDPSRPLRKTEWFEKATRTLKRWPRVKAFVYWHAIHPTPHGGAHFYVDTAPASLQAYKRMAHRGYLSKMLH